MVTIGNFLFRYRNGIFPLVYILLFIPSPTLCGHDGWAALAGFTIAILGQLLRIVTIGLVYIIRGGREHRVFAKGLVTEGLFSHCRNPLYVGNVLVIIGLGVASNSLLFMVVGIPFFLFAYLSLILAEEHYLRGRFGQDFDDYCRRVNRIVPKLSGLRETLRSMEFHWRRVLIKEYGSTFYWMAGMTLVLIKNLWLHRGFAAERGEILGLGVMVLLLIAGFFGARIIKKRELFWVPDPDQDSE